MKYVRKYSKILVFSLLFTSFLKAQNYGINLKDKNWNFEKAERLWKRAGDTLEIKFYLFNYLLINRYVFETDDNKIKPGSKVIFQQESMSCGRCAEKIVQLYKSSRKSGFRHIAGNEYLSSYKKKTKLIMIEEEGKETCLTLKFIPMDLNKKAYKKLYKSLPKSN